MLEKIIVIVATWVMSVISTMGYGGIVLLMAIESACIPLPSEIIMPFAGFLVFKGVMNLWLVALAGALGCVVGSIPAYYVGMFGGRPLAEKYGKYILLSKKDLDLADHLFDKHGEIIIFIARMLPAVRTFIAFPAGVMRMNMPKFISYTFIGSFIWCWLLAYAGMKFGENWVGLKVYFHQFHYLIVATGLVFVAWYVRRHFKH
ncbi:MAG: DedA family protein [Methylotenera sp.]|nr:DedA family protein [Methylotenera sp.]MSQ00095.1 DedA family protein [Methylotenera sp.]